LKFHPGRHRQPRIARETVAAMRKNVLAKCYGVTFPVNANSRKQKEGKRRMNARQSTSPRNLPRRSKVSSASDDED